MFLDNVTLLCIDGTGNEINQYLSIFDLMSNEISCKKYKLLTSNPNYKNIKHNSVEILPIAKLNYHDYQHFCIRWLNNYVDTDFVITFQTDGFIHNGSMWTDEFLNYDYIGEPWYSETKGFAPFSWVDSPEDAVGGGGFSLRSKKLLSLCERLDTEHLLDLVYRRRQHEDGIICVTAKKTLKENGCKYAPFELAKKFCFGGSMKSLNLLEKTFGFHSKKHLNDVLFYYKEKNLTRIKN